MNIFTLIFFYVSLLLEFFTLLILGAFLARNGCGSGAFANFVGNLFENARFTLYFSPPGLPGIWPSRPVRI
jgi:hypothetical protein